MRRARQPRARGRGVSIECAHLVQIVHGGHFDMCVRAATALSLGGSVSGSLEEGRSHLEIAIHDNVRFLPYARARSPAWRVLAWSASRTARLGALRRASNGRVNF